MEQIARSAKQLGAAVRRQRRHLGITQGELGAKVNLRQATVSKLEVGDAGVRLRTVVDVLNALGLELVVRPRTAAEPKDLEDVF